MEQRIKIEYNRQRVAQTRDGEEVGWIIGPGDESGFPTTSVVYVKSTGNDSNDGLTEINSVKSLHVAVHKAVAGELDNIIVVDSAEYSGTIDLKGKTVWFKNDATIDRVSLTSASQEYSAGVNSDYSDEILTPDGIFQAVFITEDSGAGRADIKIIKNRTQEVTTDVSGDISVSAPKEPAAFHDDNIEHLTMRPMLHWNGTRLLCFVIDYDLNDSNMPTSRRYGFVIREFEVDLSDLTVTESEVYTFDASLHRLQVQYGSPNTIQYYLSDLSLNFVLDDPDEAGRRILCLNGYSSYTNADSDPDDFHYWVTDDPNGPPSDYLVRGTNSVTGSLAANINTNDAEQCILFIQNDGSSPDIIVSPGDPGETLRYFVVYTGRPSESRPFVTKKYFENIIYENEELIIPYPVEVTTDDNFATTEFLEEISGYMSGKGLINLLTDNQMFEVSFDLNEFNLRCMEFWYILQYQNKSVEEYYNTDSTDIVQTSSDILDNHNPARTLAGFWFTVRKKVYAGSFLGEYQRILYSDPVSSIRSTALMKSEPIFDNGTVENYKDVSNYPRSVLHEGTLNRSQVSGLSQDFPSCAVLRGAGEKNLIDSLKVGIGSNNISNIVKDCRIVNCERAIGLATVQHATIHKCVYAVEGSSVVEDSIIAYCTGQYINETGVPMTITRSVIREALNQNLVPVDSILTLVKIGDPFFKSANQPFDLHLRSIFANDPINSPAIGLSLTPSIHNAAIMREAGAYDDFYASTEAWQSVTLDAPWDVGAEPRREFSSNKLSDGRHTVGALSSPALLCRLRWLAVKSETIQALQALIHADSMLIRIYFNPVSRPDIYIEGYIEPRVKLGPPAGPVTGVSDRPELAFTAQLPAGDFHGLL